MDYANACSALFWHACTGMSDVIEEDMTEDEIVRAMRLRLKKQEFAGRFSANRSSAPSSASVDT